jgi:hypothetical protein
VPTSDVRLFYVCQFILHAAKPYSLLIGIPHVARLVKRKQHWGQLALGPYTEENVTVQNFEWRCTSLSGLSHILTHFDS